MNFRGICEKKYYFDSSIFTALPIATKPYAHNTGSHIGIMPKRLFLRNTSTPVDMKILSEISIKKNHAKKMVHSDFL